MQKTRIRSLIVDGDPDWRRKIVAAVRTDPAISVIGVPSSGPAALEHLIRDAPDVLVLDLRLPEFDPIRLVRLAVSLPFPGCNVLLLTQDAGDSGLLRALQAGAGGCWLKGDDAAGVTTAIRALHAGGSPISPALGRLLLRALRDAPDVPLIHDLPGDLRFMSGATGLTSREIEILLLICKGLTIESIAGVSRISAHTVVAHMKSIYRKLKVHSRGEAVFEARQLGLL